MEFSRQEYWKGLPFPSPGDFYNPEIETGSPALQADSLPSEPPGKPHPCCTLYQYFTPFYCWVGNGTPLQSSCLKNPMDRGAWWAAVHGVAKSRARLNDFTFTFHFHALEKEMAPHSSVLAWRIPGTGEPGGLPSMELDKIGQNWSNLAAAFHCMHISHVISWWTFELFPCFGYYE